ncbi:MAG: 1-deoxy-D-xylulose-5-phosphate reductoisomerase [Clostridiales bacterium]|nr:1-deoxy-D-xylulose-5-phosphate reductoisomerase [Clostridiales bacterium]
MKKVLILGSTGSIGCQTLDIIRENKDKFEVAGLTCRSRVDVIISQIREFSPSAVCVGSEKDAVRIKSEFRDLEVLYGEEGLVQIAKMECDIVLNALMGISGLAPTCEAIKGGKDIALANKETLVAGGKIVTDLAKQYNINILPVDSEHSAIFQCLEGKIGRNPKKIILTASGGPFRGFSLGELESVRVEEALNHPKWRMGSKITIDSATMMNKGLEVIEARWLFDIPGSKIDICVHPQSIVHSMVEFEDTSVMAQLGLPDMRIPISLALNYPNRLPYEGESLDFFTVGSHLTFEKPDKKVFRCIELAYTALEKGGSYTVAMNGANEELVEMFLKGKIKFTDIPNIIECVMNSHKPSNPVTVEEILYIDRESRRKVKEIVD